MLQRLAPGCWVEPDAVTAVVVDDDCTVCVIVDGKKRDVFRSKDMPKASHETSHEAALRYADGLANKIVAWQTP